jgi:hypothetical protein
MTKFFIIAWFTISMNGEPVDTKYIINTSLQFDALQNCELFVAVEYMPLEIGVKRHLNFLFPGKTTSITQIDCVSRKKLIELDKIPQ